MRTFSGKLAGIVRFYASRVTDCILHRFERCIRCELFGTSVSTELLRFRSAGIYYDVLM